MKQPQLRYIDTNDVVHACVLDWSAVRLACQTELCFPVINITAVALTTPITCVWCAAGTTAFTKGLPGIPDGWPGRPR